jgi:hypothetical protein
MALTQPDVKRAIEIVGSDKAARSRIDSVLAPVLGTGSGFFRNLLLATGYGFAKLPDQAIRAVGRHSSIPPFVLAHPSKIPLDPNRKGSLGYELQCTEIAVTAAAAIERKKESIPALESASQCARSKGFAHAGVLLAMKGGSQYVLDWWLTLDVANPVVFRADDFDQDRGWAGVEFEEFRGFA